MKIAWVTSKASKSAVVAVPAYAGGLPEVGGKSGGRSRGSDGGLKVGDSVGQAIMMQAGDGWRLVVSLGKKADATNETFRRAGGVIVNTLMERDIRAASVDFGPVGVAADSDQATALCEGLLLGAFRFCEHKSDTKGSTPPQISLIGAGAAAQAKKRLARTIAVCDSTNLARELGHQPPNIINPPTLATRAQKLAASTGLKCTVFDEKQLARMKAGGILGVGQGSDSPPRLIVLEHKGAGKGKPVVLVGKAITFDTGGYSIKSKDGILGMKYDKCGGMAVMGAMQAAAELKVKTPVVGLIAAAENMISGGAYRPDDIITTMSGKTVEIVSADAEGRMVLCDALTYAQKHYRPRAIIDLATLTGGVVVSLGHHRAGMFCDDDKLGAQLIAAGDSAYELLWRLPMDDDYLDLLKGTDSDLRNSGSREAHAIQGAIFLKQFVDKKVPWAHLDIAGTAEIDKPAHYCPKGATGFGVRLLAEYLESLGS